MNKIYNLFKKRTLLIETMAIFITSLLIVTFFITQLIISISEKKYVDAYYESNETILGRVSIEYESLANSLTENANNLVHSKEVLNFLNSDLSTASGITSIFDLNNFLNNKQTKLYHELPYSLIILGTNGTTFYSHENLHHLSSSELLNSSFIKLVNSQQSRDFFIFLENGLTKRSKHSDVLLYISKIFINDKLIGYTLFEIKENEFSKIYETLVDKKINHIAITDESQLIISSNHKSILNETLILSKNKPSQQQHINNLNLTINSQIHPTLVKKEMGLSVTLLYLLAVIIPLSFFVLSKLFKKHLDPLNALVHASDKIRQGDFSQYIHPHGTIEVQKLITSFNYMQEGLHKYVQDLIASENEKKRIEISALQLQIKPHFIYNTLSSIKFLIVSGENMKAQTAIELFIKLLEQTIYNKHEFITINEEIEINKHFVSILKIRHDKDNIQFLTNVDPSLSQLKIPKLLLQPFVENAFLHAFIDDKGGSILINVSSKNNYCNIEIIDTGVGFQLQQDNEEYSGIGIKNVKERLHLIYGTDIYFSINSELGLGTIINIGIPQI